MGTMQSDENVNWYHLIVINRMHEKYYEKISDKALQKYGKPKQ